MNHEQTETMQRKRAREREAIALSLEAIATMLQAIASRLEAIALRLEAIASRLEAIALRLEAIASRLEAIASRLEAIYMIELFPIFGYHLCLPFPSPSRLRTEPHSFFAFSGPAIYANLSEEHRGKAGLWSGVEGRGAEHPSNAPRVVAHADDAPHRPSAQLTGMDVQKGSRSGTTPWKTNMDPENHWLVEENNFPRGHCQGLRWSKLVFGSVD